MPGFPRSTDPNDPYITPCPSSWGDGQPGSADFSYFAWAVPGADGVGYKWGMALPAFCMDEAWPNGGLWNGTHGLYPDEPKVKVDACAYDDMKLAGAYCPGLWCGNDVGRQTNLIAC